MKERKEKLVNHSHVNHCFHPDSMCRKSSLTNREHEVLELVAEGLSYKHIAKRLTISLNTVNNHLRNIRNKLGAHNSIEAINTFRAWQRAREGVSGAARIVELS